MYLRMSKCARVFHRSEIIRLFATIWPCCVGSKRDCERNCIFSLRELPKLSFAVNEFREGRIGTQRSDLVMYAGYFSGAREGDALNGSASVNCADRSGTETSM